MKAPPRLLLLRQSPALHPQPASLLSKTHSAPTSPPNPSRPTRTFSHNPFTPLQTYTASRILPYHAPPLYNLIADIAAYPDFLPYCISSTVTSLSAPDPTHKKQWPRTADLRIGYGPINELFRSAVYCLPHTVLEAVAGDAAPTIPASQLAHYHEAPAHGREAEKSAGQSTKITSLVARWTFKEFPFKPAPPDGTTPQEGSASVPSSPRTEVGVVLEVRFADPFSSVVSFGAARTVAGEMIKAFEKRAAVVLGQGYGPES
ncbi:MAG: hypothetical protein Q9161_005747 [Pseudevernia consocians]